MNETPESGVENEMLRFATEMLDGQLDLIEGCRIISNLSTRFCNKETPYPNEMFFTFIAVASDADHFPVGSSRRHYARDYLKRLDREKEDYVRKSKDDIIEACQEIIKALSE
jgi:hypothetical protein